jgi:molybdenum cofactor cytidylyltransferase
MRLIDALRLSELRLGDLPRSLSLAFVGAGGKTGAVFNLASEILETGFSKSVFVTTTTHLSVEQTQLGDHHLEVATLYDLSKLKDEIPKGMLVFTAPLSQVVDREPGKAVGGLNGDALEWLHHLGQRMQVPLLIEADGSRMRPLKAPTAHEPAIPDWVDAVVVVAGLKGLGLPLSDVTVHRPEIFSSLSGISPGEMIIPAALARVLSHPAGGLKNIPRQARRIVLLNTFGAEAMLPHVQGMAKELLRYFDAVIAAGIALSPEVSTVHAVYEKIAGIILAAGAAKRFGDGSSQTQAKQLLSWRGESLVRHAARAALAAGLDPIVVVTGAYADSISQALDGLPVVFAHNPAWAEGQSQSLRAGLHFRSRGRSLAESAGAAVFLLADQPQIPPTLVRLLVEQHSASLAPIVAPLVGGRRANPVLFDRSTFPDLLSLTGDTGGRVLFQRYPVSWVPWLDESVLLDVDTPEDYERLLQF